MLKALLGIKMIALAVFLFAIPSQQASAGINLPSKCKLPHIKIHYGTALKKSYAKNRAVRKWQTRARQVHSWSYRKWSNAHKRSINCHKKGRWWKCSAGAYACR